MTVKLLHHTPLHITSSAIRTCWQSFDKSDTYEATKCVTCEHVHEEGYDTLLGCDKCSVGGSGEIWYDYVTVTGEKDKELIDRVGNKYKHSSTLEHVSYNFFISGISRALLQELARHRVASLSVKSTRYTLKELKNEEYMTEYFDKDAKELVSKYLVWTDNKHVDTFSYQALYKLQAALKKGISNDIAKYCLPESFKTELTWTSNARSLQNFLRLRSNKAALWEIRELSEKIYEALPEEHKYLFTDCMYKEDKKDCKC